MSAFLHWYVIVLTVLMLIGSWWLIRWTSKPGQTDAATGDTTGHSWDGLEEFNNPLPRWWLWLFYITLVFAVVYLALYPGLGNFKGMLGWTQESQYNDERSLPATDHRQIRSAPNRLRMGISPGVTGYLHHT